ncbi:MAG: glycosyltransferase [Proteobacteria bacterium]|nr:glycosyltransferase [Pseudomonadota bacterium]MBU1738364.1 glycosyltransferase [Pseudomonadota bacterium]
MIPLRQGLTVVMPARDEEVHLRDAAGVVLDVVPRYFADFELIIVNDGSTDRTGEIAEELAASHPRVMVVHNLPARGLGGVVRQGIEKARMGLFMYVDSKGATPEAALDKILGCHGHADLIIPYPTNTRERNKIRNLISWAYKQLLNLLFGLRLRYYNHLVLYRTSQVRGIKAGTDSYAFQAVYIIKLLKGGASFMEVGVEDCFNLEGRKSKAFSISNMIGISLALLRLFRQIHSRNEQDG